MERGHILLHDKPAEKQGAWAVSIIKRVSSVQALKGELLIAIPHDKIVGRSDGTKPHNYRLVKDETVSLYADPTDDVAPLNDHEFLILEAIKSPLDRYEAFLNKMDWGQGLKLGDVVYVTIPGKAPTSNVRVSAIVRYAGQTANHSGILFGVEIMEKSYHGYGTTDGTFQGTRYFTCKDDCGLFVALDRVSSVKDHGNTHTEPSREGPSQQHNNQYGLRSQSKLPKGSSVDAESQFKVGERVIVYNKKNVAIRGTVKWVGVLSEGKEFRVSTVGVETDIAVKKEDFEDAIPVRSQMFKVSTSHHGRVYLPEVFVVREKEGGDERPSHEQPVNREQLLRREQPRSHEQPLNRDQPLRHQQPRSPASSFNVQHRENLAQTYGYQSEAEMLHEQSEALRQAQQGKEAKELKEIQKAVQTEQIDIDEQREALRDMEEKKKAAAAAAAKLHMQQPSSESKTSVNNSPPFGSQTSFPGSHPSSDIPGSAATQAPCVRQHSSREVAHHLYDTADSLRGQFDTAEAQYGARGYNQGQQQHPSQSTAWPQSSSHEAVRQYGATSTPLAKQQGSPQPFPSLGTGSTVQVSDPPRYGVIRWIGMLQSFQGAIAGIELEEYMDGCGDGVWDGTRHFTCAPGKGFFCLLANVKPDHRFTEGVSTVALKNPLDHVPLEEPRDQYISGTQIQKYLGEGRGIQGHQNSCYLDATVFGLFALSDVFDPMFLKEAKNPAGEAISNMLWKGIVNPLRKNGVVRHESVMALRNKLEELGKMKGVNQDEKDPEEFLNMLFKHTLNVEPFISIKRPFGTEQEYFVQLFLEPDTSLKQPPTVGGLLSKMFKEQNILFTQVPSKLLIQIPRFGRQFKTYEKVLPALQLDVIDLIDSPDHCYVCEKPARNKCSECIPDFPSKKKFVYFCDNCCRSVHHHSARVNHATVRSSDKEIHENVGAITELDLLSVICIETSHYVCFTRSAAQDRWIFFDSMANRVYDKYNIPKGVDCTQDLNEWVYTKDHTMLMKTPSRELPEFVRRFTQDIYLCVYIQPDVDMYGCN